jgi:hypothetical protein
MFFHTFDVDSWSNKRLVSWSGSYVDSKKGCQLESISQEPKLLIFILQTGYPHNISYNLPKLNFAGINVVAKWFCQRVALAHISFKTTLRHHLHIRPALHRCQGKCSPQIQHSYWCKSWNQPQGLYIRCQGWHRKKLFNLPQVSNKCWTWPCIGPKAEKRIPSNLGG